MPNDNNNAYSQYSSIILFYLEDMKGARKMCVLFSKLIGKKDNKQEAVTKMMMSIVRLVQEWKDDRMIIGVLDKDNILIDDKIVNISDQMSDSRTIRVKSKKIQVFISVYTKYRFYDLITDFKESLMEESVRLSIKTTIPEHTVKVGVLVGPNLKFVVKDWYKKTIMIYYKYDKKIFELKRETVYEKY